MKKISPVIIVGIILTAVSVRLYTLEERPAFISAAQSFAYDTFLKRVNVPPQTDKVVVVDIDEASLNAAGQWPWPRFVLADLTARLINDGAKVLAFDMFFPEEDRTSPAVLKGMLDRCFLLDTKIEGVPDDLMDFDSMFAESLSAGNSILGCFLHQVEEEREIDRSGDPVYSGVIMAKGQGGFVGVEHILPRVYKITASNLKLDQVTTTAYCNANPDDDNKVRSVPLVMAMSGDRLYPSLALEAVRRYRGDPRCIVNYNEMGVINVSMRDLVIRTDKIGRLVVNYRTVKENKEGGFWSSFPMYSAIDVLRSKTPEGTFDGKIVFVGTSAPGLRDLRATPLCPEFSGVEIHATIVDNILSGDMLRDPPIMETIHLVALGAVCLLLTILVEKSRAWVSIVTALSLIALSIAVTFYLFEQRHIVFIPAWMIVSIIVIYSLLTTIKFWQEEHQRRQVRHMFGTMVSGDVLQYLEKNPESFSLSGQKAEATMFFSDVENFTTISESLEPARLSDLLNRYLSPMTDIIMKRNGYVDKYEGDAIMAEWGVPFPMHDHAVQACLAALEQQAELAELRPWLLKGFGHEITVRMGLNSGTVTAGNMGSNKRFSYTVMGDAVNQAARFEPTNKDYKTDIIIGETTRDEARDAIEVRFLDKIVVKGKTKPISIFELLAKKGELPNRKAEVVGLYEEALRLHWDRDWDAALARLESALELDFRDGPSATLRTRVAWYRENPPDDSWSGEYVRATKD